MTSSSLLVLLFVILPGFLADAVARIAFGDKKLTDFERTVRSLAFSILGLFLYALLYSGIDWLSVEILGFRPTVSGALRVPPYLAAIADPTGQTPLSLGITAVFGFVLHTASTIVVACLWGWIVTRPKVQDAFSKVTGRAFGGTAWVLLWTRYLPPTDGALTAEPRWITVQLKNGGRVMGQFQASTDTPDEAKDLIIGNPWFWNPKRDDWYAQNIKYLFIPAAEIGFIALAPVGDQTAVSGYMSELTNREVSNGKA